MFFFTVATAQHVYVLGTAQDAGYPHIGCRKQCCRLALDSYRHEPVTCLAVTDTVAKRWWLFEATPDITHQLNLFRSLTDSAYPYLPEAVFITHAHIGHYTGLMYFGREGMNTKQLPVYVGAEMEKYLRKNGPWSQLVSIGNIALKGVKREDSVMLGVLCVRFYRVFHRSEFAKPFGFSISIHQKRILFVPDTDHWYAWHKLFHTLPGEIGRHDLSFIDATFYSGDELPGRKMEEVKHPLVTETMKLLDRYPDSVRARVQFNHFNHTNPLLWNPEIQQRVKSAGYGVARTGRRY